MLGLHVPLWRRKTGGLAASAGSVQPAIELGLWISPTGNDTTGDGTSAAPYQTLSKALSVVTNGGIINCKTGIYYGMAGATVTTPNVMIRAGNGQAPIFTHATNYAAGLWSKTAGQTNVYEVAFIPAAFYWVWSGATRLTSTASVNACDALANSYYFDDPGDKVYINLDGAVPGDIAFEIGNAAQIIANVGNTTIDGITFQWGLGGFVVLNTPGVIKNCTGRYFGTWGASMFALKAAGCVIQDSSMTAGPENWGVEISGAGANACTVARCTTSSGKHAVTVESGTGHIVEDCNFYGLGTADSDGVLVQGAVNSAVVSATVRRCVITDFAHGFVLVQVNATALVHHCRMYKTLNFATGYGIIGHCPVEGYHNVVDFSVANSGNGFLCDAVGLSLAYKNNVAIGCGVGFYYLNGTLDTAGNVAYGNGTDFSVGWTLGTGDTVADPLFTNSATRDYSLQSGSPCIDNGVVLAGINDGYLGLAPDSGYLEKA